MTHPGYERKREWALRNADRVKASRDRYNRRNPAKVSACKAAYRDRNREQIRLANVDYRRMHPERTRAATRRWRVRNPALARKLVRRWVRLNAVRMEKLRSAWVKSNPHKVAAQVAKRRAELLQRVPPWANLEKIELIYRRSILKTMRSGVLHQVDHTIPLRGKRVSGLHVEANLRVITRKHNREKSNHFHGRTAYVGA